MNDREIREELIYYGNKLIETAMTLGTGGNLSVFDREAGLMYITPSGIEFDLIEPDDIVVLDLEGQIQSGHRKPSSEWAMHLIFYQNRTDIDAVIHAHTTYSTVFACLNEPLPASHYMLAVAGADVRCAPYAGYGTKELAQHAYEHMIDRRAVLLANHGIIAGERSLKHTFNVLEEVEYCAKIHILARSIGTPVLIPEAEMANMAERFKTYGQNRQSDS